MTQTTKLIRLTRISGTREFRLTVGDQVEKLSKMQALHLMDDAFKALWGADFNYEATRKEGRN